MRQPVIFKIGMTLYFNQKKVTDAAATLETIGVIKRIAMHSSSIRCDRRLENVVKH